jgi:hypothetical protein
MPVTSYKTMVIEMTFAHEDADNGMKTQTWVYNLPEDKLVKIVADHAEMVIQSILYSFTVTRAPLVEEEE